MVMLVNQVSQSTSQVQCITLHAFVCPVLQTFLDVACNMSAMMVQTCIHIMLYE